MLSPVAVTDPDADPLALPRKFLDGVTAFAELWQGPVTLLLPRSAGRDDNLDYLSIPRAALPCDVYAFPNDVAALRNYIQAAALVFALMSPRYVNLPPLCASCRVPCVVDADLTPKIREEIIRSENTNPLLRWRRILWQRNMEHNFTAMARTAQGIQLNGPVAYATYAPLNPSPLMYFNTRVRRAMLPTTKQRQARAERLLDGAPLRLVYSGRWRAMKGVPDLPHVAAELRRLGVRAEWNIFGSGMLQVKLERAIADAGLDNMRLRGELAFPELMRQVADECDLFVCCHRQGDPSTTFIEMLSMGIPLIGYDTGGLRGIVSASRAGWLTPLDNAPALAARIAELDRARETLVTACRAATEFAHDKCFENLMQRRVAHLHDIAAEFTKLPDRKGQVA